MDHDMQCLSANPKMAGPAYTVRVHPADILMIATGLSECPRGHTLVIDGQGELNTALWGELTTLAALRKGLAGVVIDGAVRDIGKIRRSRLPVFARAVVPNGGGAEYPGELGVAVTCGGQVVRSGDWLVGDEDGVVVIPLEKVRQTLLMARRIIAAERKIERAIRGGEDLVRLLRSQETIQRKESEVFIPQLRAERRRR
ncbi:MAG: RraA family protein [Candidatus Solibacter usitatus]|nr:RraA family protein [Candidatus Solibacter usitatus]